MTDKTLPERLKSGAEYLRRVEQASGTTIPGSRERRVWIDPNDAGRIARDMEDAADALGESPSEWSGVAIPVRPARVVSREIDSELGPVQLRKLNALVPLTTELLQELDYAAKPKAIFGPNKLRKKKKRRAQIRTTPLPLGTACFYPGDGKEIVSRADIDGPYRDNCGKIYYVVPIESISRL